MSDAVDLLPVLFIAFLVVSFAVPLWWSRRAGRQVQAVAEGLGLRPYGPDQPGWMAWFGLTRPWRGTVHGRTVQLRVFTTGSGKSRSTWTAIEVPLPAADPAFRLRVQRQGLGQRLAKALGAQDVEVGNPEFDDAFRVAANDAARAQRALGFEAQQALLALPSFAEVRVAPCVETEDGGFRDAPELQQGWHTTVGIAPGLDLGPRGLPAVAVLRWTVSGLLRDADKAQHAVAPLVRLAEALERAAPRQGSA